MTCTLLELYGSMVASTIQIKSYLHPIALWFHGAGAEEPVLLAALVLGFELSADAGAEQWYKTIAKLMQGRNRNSTHTIANINCGFHSCGFHNIRLVATWLILPVVICLS